jgi:thymidylate synthase (FAD)
MSEVNLIGITKPSAYTDCTSANELVAWAARVSNPSNQNNTQTAGKLVKYLINNKHFSPLEMVHVVMNISTTRDIARQILRHRSFSFQEYSQRYADPTKDLGFVTREARLQDPKNRQNSVETEDSRLEEEWNMRQRKSMAEALISYRWAIENGIAKEQARAVLPEGNTESTIIMAGSLRSFWHYILVRHHPATQKEHRIVAEQISDIIMHHFPDMRELLEEQIANNYKDESNH